MIGTEAPPVNSNGAHAAPPAQPPPSQIADWLGVFVGPGQHTELRALAGRAVVTEHFTYDQLDRMAARTVLLQAQRPDLNVYFIPNPLEAGLGRKAAGKKNVLSYRWLKIDCDPVRFGPDGAPLKDQGVPSTDAERAAAWHVLDVCQTTLERVGLRGAVVADSGNGYWPCFPIDLPNDEASAGLMRRLLQELKDRCSTDQAGVDVSVADPSHLVRLFGSWNRKGTATAERPHRLTRLVEGRPWDAEVAAANVDAALRLLEMADFRRNHGPEGRAERAYAEKVLKNECGKVGNTPPKGGPLGGRNRQLNASAFNLGQFVGAGALSQSEVEAGLTEAAVRCGLDRDGDCGPNGIAATIRSGLNAGAKQPRDLSWLSGGTRKNGTANPHVNGAAPAGPGPDADPDVIERASAITPRPVEWLWPGVIPLGKLTTFAGVGGLGKTFVLLDIAARITRGEVWPLSGGARAPHGQVLFISGEDDPDDTLVPRLIAMGADLDRITFLKTSARDEFTLKDLPTLTRAVVQTGPGVLGVVIDPPTAYLGDVDDHKNAELRQLLTPLQGWCSKHRIATVFNTHVNKQSARVDAMMRVMGSAAWVNAVRAAHLFVRDPDDPEQRLFLPMKMNLAKERKGLAYKIVPTGNLARVEWLKEVDTTADDAINQGKRKPRKVGASEWLALLFAEADELPSDDIWDRRRAESTDSANAVKEAKEEMGIKARQTADPDGKRYWVWYWPPEARQRWQERPRQGPDE